MFIAFLQCWSSVVIIFIRTFSATFSSLSALLIQIGLWSFVGRESNYCSLHPRHRQPGLINSFQELLLGPLRQAMGFFNFFVYEGLHEPQWTFSGTSVQPLIALEHPWTFQNLWRLQHSSLGGSPSLLLYNVNKDFSYEIAWRALY